MLSDMQPKVSRRCRFCLDSTDTSPSESMETVRSAGPVRELSWNQQIDAAIQNGIEDAVLDFYVYSTRTQV